MTFGRARALLKISRRFLPSHVDLEAGLFVKTQSSRVVPIVCVEPDAPGLRVPFAVKGGVQKPRAQTLSLGRRDEPKIPQFNVGQAAFEFTEPECSLVAISEDVNPAALRFEKMHQFGTRHLEALIPPMRLSNTSIKVQVLANGQPLVGNALVSLMRGNR